MRILIFNGEMDHSLDIGLFLKKIIPDCEIYLLCKRRIFKILEYLTGINILIRKSQNNLFNTISKLDNTIEFDWIIPVSFDDIKVTLDFISKKPNSKITRKIITLPNRNAFLKVADKYWLLNTAKDVGIPTPKTIIISNKKHLAEVRDKISFPVFVKQNSEKYKLNGLVKNWKDLIKISELILTNGEQVLIQEYISNPETYGFGFLAKDGKVIEYVMHKEVFSIPPSGGSAILLEKLNNSKILSMSKKLIGVLNYSGFGLIEYKKDSSGKFILMEINPKFWASILFSLLNRPSILCKLIAKDSSEDEKSIFKTKVDALLYNSRLVGTGIFDWNYFREIINYIKEKYKYCNIFSSSSFRGRSVESFYSIYYTVFYAKRLVISN